VQEVGQLQPLSLLELAVHDKPSQLEEFARQRYDVLDGEVLECVEEGALESHPRRPARKQTQRQTQSVRIGDECREVDGGGIDLVADRGGEVPAGGQRIRRTRQGVADRRRIDVKSFGEAVPERARQLRLPSHHPPELLPRRSGIASEVLLREAALDPQHLDLLADRRQLDERFGKGWVVTGLN
jgi:hypothetical protein